MPKVPKDMLRMGVAWCDQANFRCDQANCRIYRCSGRRCLRRCYELWMGVAWCDQADCGLYTGQMNLIDATEVATICHRSNKTQQLDPTTKSNNEIQQDPNEIQQRDPTARSNNKIQQRDPTTRSNNEIQQQDPTTRFNSKIQH